jgi:LacI family transcriptional regulator
VAVTTSATADPAGGAGRVTIAHIAATAGVSPGTVSKVLNGRDDVASHTRAAVQRLLDEAGYERRGRPGRPAHRLLELVMTDLGTPWASEVLRGAEEAAQDRGVGLVVTATHSREAGSRDWLDALTERESAGVVLVASRLAADAAAEVSALRTPLVVVDPVGGFDPAVPRVGATNWAGGLAATEHLLALGHRRIGIVTGPEQLLCSRQRLEGYLTALSRAGVPADPALIRYGDFRPAGGRAGTAALLDVDNPPTAVFAGSDQQATGVYAEARHRGLRLPEDLSVVGFDDVPLCQWLSPQLTTVRQPMADMARVATRMVLDHRGPWHPERVPSVELSTELVVRDSTCPPSSGSHERPSG